MEFQLVSDGAVTCFSLLLLQMRRISSSNATRVSEFLLLVRNFGLLCSPKVVLFRGPDFLFCSTEFINHA